MICCGCSAPSALILDLDTPRYLDVNDIQEYVRRTLLAGSDSRSTSPYRGQPAAAATIARAIAARAVPSFLVAQLTALSRPMPPSRSIQPFPAGWKRSRRPSARLWSSTCGTPGLRAVGCGTC